MAFNRRSALERLKMDKKRERLELGALIPPMNQN